ncbi:hypothetical protein H8E88_15155 [candidate division KSB1 bacterium]|nr:hypothetical protein [candidate division KSB1 bacterium]
MKKLGISLDKVSDSVSELKEVQKSGLRFGDLVLIHTRNSVYSVNVLDKSLFLVSGGWFDRKGLSPMKTTINGCTWGGSMIKLDVVAACGLCIEFGNRVVTTPVRKVCVIPNGGEN